MIRKRSEWGTAVAAVGILSRRAIGLLAIGVPLVFGFSVPAVSQTNPASGVDLNDMRVRVQTKAREMTIGRQASRRLERRIKLVKVEAVQEYVDRIAQNLARNSDAQVPITVKIVASNEVNPLSHPGGFLYINSGLMLAVDDDAELASVMAHEIGHVVARDGMKSGRYLGMGPDITPVVVATPDSSKGMADLGGYLVPLKFLGSPRETEADYRAIQYMQKAGYNPKAMLTFLGKMQAKEKTESDSVLAMFQTHPPTADRIKLVEDRVGATPFESNPQMDTTTELQKIKALLLENQISNPEAYSLDLK